MEMLPMTFLVWIGILFCISQSAMFSGLNLALLGISRLRLEVEADSGDPRALLRDITVANAWSKNFGLSKMNSGF